MRPALAAVLFVAVVNAAPPPPERARSVRVPVHGANLYAREIGRGEPIILLHGGPDFDHTYLLPDMDRLSDRYRLIYYDQRGRGQSAAHVAPTDVTLASEIADLDAVRQFFGLQSATVLGHSWGTVLAMEYALRHPDRVSRLILMNPAPASAADYADFRAAYLRALGPDVDRMLAIAATDAYRNGDPDTVAARYRIHFRRGLARPADLDKVMASLRASFTSAGILKARQVEDRLTEETWAQSGYNLLPKVATLHIPTLVIYGDHDMVPRPTAEHIASAIPGARFVTFANCGHFSYLECPAPVRTAIDGFFDATPAAARP